MNEFAQSIDIAVTRFVFSKNVVVRNNYNAFLVPNFASFPNSRFKHPDGTWTTNVMRHQDIGVYPDIITGLTLSDPAACARIFSVIVHTHFKLSP